MTNPIILKRKLPTITEDMAFISARCTLTDQGPWVRIRQDVRTKLHRQALREAGDALFKRLLG